MRDTLSLLASSTTVPRHHHQRRRHSTTTTSAGSNSSPKPSPPLFSTVRLYNQQGATYYAGLTTKLAEAGRFDDLLIMVEAAAVEFEDREAVSRGIARMLDERKVKDVEVVLSSLEKLGMEPREVMNGAAMAALKGGIDRMLKRGEVEEIVSLLETLDGFHLPIKELMEPSRIIRVCINKSNPTAAVRCAQVFPHGQILCCSIILEFGKKRDLVSALTAFEVSKKNLSSPNMHLYRTIIDICGLCGDYMKTRTIYQELRACKVTPNTYVFNSLMNVNSRDLDYTLNIYKQMQELGIRADIASYNILLKSCCLAAKVDLARDIYKEVRGLESQGALKLDVFTYSTMIKVFADAKMWNLALEIKEDMLSSGVTPNTITWSSLISACANAGLVDQAMKLFDEMLQAGGQPNSQCFNALLHACVEACQYDRAFRLFQSWKESSLPGTITSGYQGNTKEDIFVRKMSKTGSSLMPHSHLSTKVPFRPTISTYNILMKACGTDCYRAKALMDEMKTAGLSPDHITWSILIDIYGGSRNIQGAMQVLRSMRDAGIQPDVVTYTTIIKISVENKDLKLAFALFAEMKKYQVKPNLVTFNTLLRARSRYGSLQEVQQCLALYQDMRKAGYRPNDYYLKQLIEEWCEGVIQDRNQRKDQCASFRTKFGSPSLLLEKIAELLQDSNADNLSIDLQGLTKVEARIVVLAVLRMAKEKYTAGDLITDDMLIILRVKELGAGVGKDESGVKEAVIRLLQHDLGLQVHLVGSRIAKGKTKENSINSSLKLDESPTRRPVVLERLKIPKESLHQWLQRKMIASKK